MHIFTDMKSILFKSATVRKCGYWAIFSFQVTPLVINIALFLGGMASTPAHAALVLGDTAQETDEQPKKSLMQKVRGRSKKISPRKNAVPPFFVEFEPTLVELPQRYQVPDDFVVEGGYLDLQSLCPATLAQLSLEELKTLLDYLAKIPVKIKWSDKNGHSYSKKDKRPHSHCMVPSYKSNAAAALTFTMGAILETELFTTMVALSPEATLPALQGQPSILLDVEVSARILGIMINKLGRENSGKISQAIGYLTKLFIKFWAEKDPERLKSYLSNLLTETQKIVETGRHKFKEKRVGILLGSILAGAIKYADGIREKDDQRIWVVYTVTNIIWAATSYMGAMPLTIVAGGIAAGTISVGVVLFAAIYSKLGASRNFVPSIKEIEGQFELMTLEASQLKGNTYKLNVLMLLSWMRAAMHVNGLFD